MQRRRKWSLLVKIEGDPLSSRQDHGRRLLPHAPSTPRPHCFFAHVCARPRARSVRVAHSAAHSAVTRDKRSLTDLIRVKARPVLRALDLASIVRGGAQHRRRRCRRRSESQPCGRRAVCAAPGPPRGPCGASFALPAHRQFKKSTSNITG